MNPDTVDQVITNQQMNDAFDLIEKSVRAYGAMFGELGEVLADVGRAAIKADKQIVTASETPAERRMRLRNLSRTVNSRG